MSRLGDHKGKEDFEIADKKFEKRSNMSGGVNVFQRIATSTGNENNDTDSFLDNYAPIHARLEREEPFPGYYMYYQSINKGQNIGDPKGTLSYQRNVFHDRTFTWGAYNSTTRKTPVYYRSNEGKVQNIHDTRSLKVKCDILWCSGTDDTFKTRVTGSHVNLTTGEVTDLGNLHDNGSRGSAGHKGAFSGNGTAMDGGLFPKYDRQVYIYPQSFGNYEDTLDLTIPPNTELRLKFLGAVWGGSNADRVGLGHGKFSGFTMV